MTDLDARRLISWSTLAGAAVATLVMGVWGFNSLTAPIEKDSSPSSSSTDGTDCPPAQAQYVTRGEVTVSVFNAGQKAGRAQDTLDLLENAGFVAGAVGNAPSGDKVTRAEVHTTHQDDPEAKLVALALGHDTPVVVTTVIGPGLDVIIGDKFKKLDPTAPRRVPAQASSAC